MSEKSKATVDKEKVVKDVEEKKEVTKGQNKSGKGQTYPVDVDNTPEQVIKLDSEGFELIFSIDRFLELPDEVVNELSRVNFKNYYVAQSQVKQKELDLKNKKDPVYQDWELSPLGGNATKRMKKVLRERRGWHQCLKSPDEWDEAMANGYVPIRKLSKEQEEKIKSGKKKKEDFIGYEDGEIARLGSFDKPELLACEIPEEVFKRHLAAVGYKSKGRYAQNKQEYAEKARRAGLLPFDTEDEIGTN
jgi:hypothetical protein